MDIPKIALLMDSVQRRDKATMKLLAQIKQAEPAEIGRAVDRDLFKANDVQDMPAKYIRALIGLLSVRYLANLATLGEEADEKKVLKLQGGIKEILELQTLFQLILAERVFGREAAE
jgi:hypothetical protein